MSRHDAARRATSRTPGRAGRSPLLWLAMLMVLLASMLLTACGSDATQVQAQANKAKLDQELTHARTDLGLPDRLLQPIEAQEHKVASGEGGLFYNYSDAASNFNLLYTQLLGVEQTAKQTLQTQAEQDLQAFASILNQRQAEGFIEAAAYQARFTDANTQYDQAQSAADYAKVSDLAEAQTQALQAMWPAYQKLLAFQKVIQSLNAAGINTTVGQQLYDQDLQVFRDAASADRYGSLVGIIDAQTLQVLADETAAQPYITAQLLDEFQARITLLGQKYGDTTDAATFQKQHDADATTLRAARQLTDYLNLARTILQENNAMDLPLVRGQTQQDYAVLKQLVNYAQAITILNNGLSTADGRRYPVAAEYADPYVGIGDARDKLNAAKTAAQYQSADFEIQSLTACLRAQLDDRDLSDPTNAVPKGIDPHHPQNINFASFSQPRPTDLELMKFYNIVSGKVVMVSIAEQFARFYDNGTLVYAVPITTGAQHLPSVPGYHTAQYRVSPTEFISPDPPGSPDYYAPTFIHYAVNYSDGGYFLHDAWWRSTFGPYTDLPHHDPAAFNGGSHGCVNIPLANMSWVYNWTVVGTPIILY